MADRPVVEGAAYLAFLSRAIRSAGRRAASDPDLLPSLLELSSQLDEAMTRAVHGCRTEGYSWAEIASRLGCTRQAAQQRFGAISVQCQGEVDK